MKNIFFALALIIWNNCSAQESNNDFNELNDVYNELVDVLKSKSDAQLMAYCYKLAPDESSLSFLRKNELCYNGIPCDMDEEGLGINAIVQKFYPNLINIRERLEYDGLLKNLTHVDSTTYKYDSVFIPLLFSKKDNKQLGMNSEYFMLLDKIDKDGGNYEDFIELRNVEIKGTEEDIVLNSGKQFIYYSLGEMIKINNKWSLWTIPNVDYYIQNE